MRNKRGRKRSKERLLSLVFPKHLEATEKLGGRGWCCLSVTNPLREKIKLMYFPGRIGAHHRHQRNSLVGGLSEENAFIFYSIWRLIFFQRKGGDPIVELYHCSPWISWKSSADIHECGNGSGVWPGPGELPLLSTTQTGLASPEDPCVLSFREGSACMVFFSGAIWCLFVQMGPFCLATEPEQPSLLMYSWPLWHFLRAPSSCLLWFILLIFPLICYGQGELSSGFTKAYNTATSVKKKKTPVCFHLPQTPAFKTQDRQDKVSFSSHWHNWRTAQFPPAANGKLLLNPSLAAQMSNTTKLNLSQ